MRPSRLAPTVADPVRRPWLAAALVLAALLVGLMGGAPAARAQEVQPVPALTGRAIDRTATLSEPQRAALDAQLAAFEAQAGTQIVVLIVADTAPEDIAAYAQRVADAWKIGRRDIGDGVLLLVSKNDRRVRIEVAKTLEGAVPDLAARQIIDRAIVPTFRNGDYAGGLSAAVDLLSARIRGEGLAAPATPPAARGAHARPGGNFESVGLFFFAVVGGVGWLLSRLFGRKLGSVVTAGVAGGAAWFLGAGLLLAVGAGLLALFLVGVVGMDSVFRMLVLSRMSGGGRGGGFGGGGGGFRSGGGGDFGGGGASGKW